MRLFSLLLFFLCTQVWGVKQNFILNGEYYASPADSLYGNLKRIGIYDFIPDASKQTTVFLHFSPYKYRNTHTGINSGIGLRKALSSAIYGVNFYYDYQRDVIELDQLGVGFEFFSDLLNIYGNIYLPFGAERFGSEAFHWDDYIGNYAVSCWQERIVSKGFDLNFCKEYRYNSFFRSSFCLGLYGLDFRHCCTKFLGFQGSVKLYFLETLYVEPMICTDKAYGTDFIVKMEFTYPFYGKAAPTAPLYQPVKRKGFIPTRSCCHYTTNY